MDAHDRAAVGTGDDAFLNAHFHVFIMCPESSWSFVELMKRNHIERPSTTIHEQKRFEMEKHTVVSRDRGFAARLELL